MRRRSAQYFLERSAEGRWTSAGAEEACVFASESAARRALANVVRGGGAERAELRIRRSEWSETLVRYLEVIL